MKKALSIVLIITTLVLSGCVIDFGKSKLTNTDNLFKYSDSADLSESFTSADVSLNINASEASVAAIKDSAKLAEGSFTFSNDRLKPKFEVNGNSINIQNSISGLNLNNIASKWDVKLTNKLPLDFNINTAASKTDIYLNDMLVKSLNINASGGSSLKVFSDKLNQVALEDFKIDVNAANLDFYGVGNVNAETMYVDANASRLNLDMTGELAKDIQSEINGNASTIRIKLPDNIGVRIIIDESDISTIRMNNKKILKVTDKEYLSKNYEECSIKMTLFLKLNITTITFE